MKTKILTGTLIKNVSLYLLFLILNKLIKEKIDLAQEINKIEKSIIAANSGINRERSKSIFMITNGNNLTSEGILKLQNNEQKCKENAEGTNENNQQSLYKNVLKKGVNSSQVNSDTNKSSSLVIEELSDLTKEPLQETCSSNSSGKSEEGYSSRFNWRTRSRDAFCRRSNSFEIAKDSKTSSSIKRSKNKHDANKNKLKVIDLSKVKDFESNKSVGNGLNSASFEDHNDNDQKNNKVLSKFAKTHNSVKKKKSKVIKMKWSNKQISNEGKYISTSMKNCTNEENSSKESIRKIVSIFKVEQSNSSSNTNSKLSKFSMFKSKQDVNQASDCSEQNINTEKVKYKASDRRKNYQQKKKTESIENFNIFFNSLDSFEGNNLIYSSKRRKSDYAVMGVELDGSKNKYSSTRLIRNVNEIDVNSKHLKDIYSKNRSRSFHEKTLNHGELFHRRRLLSDFHDLAITKQNIAIEFFTELNVFQEIENKQLKNQKKINKLEEDHDSAESSSISEGNFFHKMYNL